MKVNMNEKLSKKSTAIALALVVVFVLAGVVGAIVGHKTYLSKQEARIVNYSHTEGSTVRMRPDGTLVYCYDNEKTVTLSQLLEVSKGASMHVLREVTDTNVYYGREDVVDLTKAPHLYVFLKVKNLENYKETDYILEIVSKNDYRPDGELPSAILDDGPILQ